MIIHCKTAALCTSATGNASKRKPSKSVVNLIRNSSNNELTLLISTAKDPDTKANYSLSRKNVLTIHNKLLYDGKISITLKKPPIMIMMSDAQPAQLETLIRAIKNPEVYEDENVTPNVINKVNKPKEDVLSLRITNVKQYPSFTGVGFPKTLTSLTITNMNYRHIDLRICSLKNLKVLNLSNNKLKKVPERLFTLSLTSLDLSYNQVTEISSPHDQDMEFFNSLKCLDVSYNLLTSCPEMLNRCRCLYSLKLSGNKISNLIHQIKRHQKTLRILHLTNCALKYMPNALRSLALSDFEISDNLFPPPLQYNIPEIYKVRHRRAVPTLKECCVKSIVRHDLTFQQLHPHLQSYVESAQNCSLCFKLVLESSLVYFYRADMKSFTSSFTRLPYPAPMAFYSCSDACFKKKASGKRVVPANVYFKRTP